MELLFLLEELIPVVVVEYLFDCVIDDCAPGDEGHVVGEVAKILLVGEPQEKFVVSSPGFSMRFFYMCSNRYKIEIRYKMT